MPLFKFTLEQSLIPLWENTRINVIQKFNKD